MTRREDLFDASDARCRQLGDLAAQAAPTPPIDPRHWRQIEEAMERPPSRHRWLLLLAPALAATGLVLWLNARRTLEHTVRDCVVAADGLISAPADRECQVAFEEGTHITLASGTQGRIDALNYRRGARFAIDHGHVDLAVIHRTSARWDVLAGPFDVHVTGTRFAVDWTPSSRRFSLRVSEGEVRVNGCRQRPDTSVRAGQGLEGDSSTNCFEPTPAASAPTVVPAPEPMPAHAEPTPAPSMRVERKRPLAGGRLAMRNPEPSGRVAPPATEPSAAQLTERDWSASSGFAPETKLGPRRLTISSDGRLIGPEPGSLIAVGGLATTFSFPHNPLADNLYMEDGALCARGRIAALNCNDEKIPNMRCDWKTNWGALIQWQPRNGQAWGVQAASSVALEFRGRSGPFRLVAHRQGDPDDLMYCVNGYRSGQRVTPSHFHLRCWAGGGTHLSDFSKVDYFSLQIMSQETVQRFRLCVSAIDLR